MSSEPSNRGFPVSLGEQHGDANVWKRWKITESRTPELWRVDARTKNNQKSAGAPPACALRTPRFGSPRFLLLLALANGAKRARRELMSQVGKWGRRGDGEALESR